MDTGVIYNPTIGKSAAEGFPISGSIPHFPNGLYRPAVMEQRSKDKGQPLIRGPRKAARHQVGQIGNSLTVPDRGADKVMFLPVKGLNHG